MSVLAGSLGTLGSSRRAAANGPVIASFSQSTSFGGVGVALATVENMSDGLPEPFVGTIQSVNTNLTATLTASSYVTSVTVGASTSTGGWGPAYLNGAWLEYSTDGFVYTNFLTLTGFAGSEMRTIPLGVTCRYIRVRHGSNQYLAISEFRVS